MNKIILLSDKEELPKGAFDFACMLNEQQPVLLTGVFLPRIDYWDSMLFYSFGGASPWIYYASAEDLGIFVEEKAIPTFKTLCQKNGIEYRIHDKEYENIREELRIESRFSDMILFSHEAFFEHLAGIITEEYTDHTLHRAECPVMVVPETFHRPEQLVLAYDGSASSVYAIRQFAALMPELAKLETTLVYVDPDERNDFPERAYIEELAARHYSNLTLMRLDIDPRKYFDTWLVNRKNALLVTGAEGRGTLSRLFRRSFLGDLLQEHRMPVFIAHK